MSAEKPIDPTQVEGADLNSLDSLGEQEEPNYGVLEHQETSLDLPKNTREVVVGAGLESFKLGREALQSTGKTILEIPYFYARARTMLRDLPKVLRTPFREIKYTSSITRDKISELGNAISFKLKETSGRVRKTVEGFVSGAKEILDKIENNLDVQKIRALEERIADLEERKADFFSKLKVSTEKPDWATRKAEKILQNELPSIKKELDALRLQIGEMMSKGLPDLELSTSEDSQTSNQELPKENPEPIASVEAAPPESNPAKLEVVPASEEDEEEAEPVNIEDALALIDKLPLNDIAKQTLKDRAAKGLDDEFAEEVEKAIADELHLLKDDLLKRYKKIDDDDDYSTLVHSLGEANRKFREDLGSSEQEIRDLIAQAQTEVDDIEITDVRESIQKA
jgi:hypothetical protein